MYSFMSVVDFHASNYLYSNISKEPLECFKKAEIILLPQLTIDNSSRLENIQLINGIWMNQFAIENQHVILVDYFASRVENRAKLFSSDKHLFFHRLLEPTKIITWDTLSTYEKYGELSKWRWRCNWILERIDSILDHRQHWPLFKHYLTHLCKFSTISLEEQKKHILSMLKNIQYEIDPFQIMIATNKIRGEIATLMDLINKQKKEMLIKFNKHNFKERLNNLFHYAQLSLIKYRKIIILASETFFTENIEKDYDTSIFINFIKSKNFVLLSSKTKMPSLENFHLKEFNREIFDQVIKLRVIKKIEQARALERRNIEKGAAERDKKKNALKKRTKEYEEIIQSSREITTVNEIVENPEPVSPISTKPPASPHSASSSPSSPKTTVLSPTLSSSPKNRQVLNITEFLASDSVSSSPDLHLAQVLEFIKNKK